MRRPLDVVHALVKGCCGSSFESSVASFAAKELARSGSGGLSVGELVENAVPAILECPQHALGYRHVVVEGAQPHGQERVGLGLAGAGLGEARTGEADKDAPLPGANSFTEGQAKSRLEANGYSNVSALKKDDNGVWKGTASHSGKQVNVSVDYRGNITRN